MRWSIDGRRRKAKSLLIYDASASPGGALTSAHALAEAALERDFEVALVLVAPRCYEESTRWIRRFDASGRVQLELLHARDFSSIRGVRWMTREARRAAELAQIIRRHEPCVSIANNTPQVNAALYLAHEEGRVFQYIRGPFYTSRLATLLLGQAERIFCVGDVAAASAVLSGRDATKVMKISEGLSASQWPSPNKAGAQRWMWAATLMRWKGLPLMLEAYGRLDPTLRPELDVCYIPVPGAEGAGSIPSCLPEGVTLHESPELDVIRQEASVLIHTALTPEPFGRVILESRAAGLCVVVPDEGGASEQVTHGVDGLRYTARSVAALERSLKLLLERPANATALGQLAAKAAARHTARVAFAKLLDACVEPTTREMSSSRGRHVPA